MSDWMDRIINPSESESNFSYSDSEDVTTDWMDRIINPSESESGSYLDDNTDDLNQVQTNSDYNKPTDYSTLQSQQPVESIEPTEGILPPRSRELGTLEGATIPEGQNNTDGQQGKDSFEGAISRETDLTKTLPGFKRVDGTPGVTDIDGYIPVTKAVQGDDRSLFQRSADVVHNLNLALLSGVIGLSEVPVGLLDTMTSGDTGRLMEKYLSYDPKASKAFVKEFYTPEQKAANKRVEEAEGFTETLIAGLENPGVTFLSVIESLPSMVGGGAMGRLISKTPAVAGAIGEGLTSLGSSAESLRQEKGTLSGRDLMNLGSSALTTSVIGKLGHNVANKLGLRDVDTLLAGGRSSASAKSAAQAAYRVAGGITLEGLEELTQTQQELVWMNASLGRPLTEGLGEAGAQSLLAGMAMGGASNISGVKIPTQRQAENILSDAGLGHRKVTVDGKILSDIETQWYNEGKELADAAQKTFNELDLDISVGRTRDVEQEVADGIKINELNKASAEAMDQKRRQIYPGKVNDPLLDTTEVVPTYSPDVPTTPKEVLRQRKVAGEHAVNTIKSEQVTPLSAEKSASVFDKKGKSLVEDILDQVEVKPEAKEVETVAKAIEDTTVKGKATITPKVVETVDMPTDEFLALATSGRGTIERIRAEGFIETGQGDLEYVEGDPASMKFSKEKANATARPYLVVNKAGKVIHHDGRHRAALSTEETMPVTIIYEGDKPQGEITPQFKSKNKVYEHPSTGNRVYEQNDGTFKVDASDKTYSTVAQANRALMANVESTETNSLEKAGGFEGKRVVAITQSPEDAMIAKEGLGLQDITNKVTTKGSPRSTLRGDGPSVKNNEAKADSVSSRIKKVLARTGTKGTPQRKAVTTKSSREDSTGSNYSNLVKSIVSGNQEQISDSLSNFPKPSQKKVLRDAVSAAKTQAIVEGTADIDQIIEASEEATKAIAGHKLLAGRVEMKGDGRGTGLYEGTDPVTGISYKALKVDGFYKVISEGDVIINDGPKSIKALLPLIKAHVESNSTFTIRKGKRPRTWEVLNKEFDNVVATVASKKEAVAYMESQETGETFVPGRTRVKSKRIAAADKLVAQKVPTGGPKTKSSPSLEDTDQMETKLPPASPVKTIPITPELKRRYESNIQHDLTSGQQTEIATSEKDISLIAQELEQGDLTTLKVFLPKDLQVAAEIAEKALKKINKKVRLVVDPEPNVATGSIVSKVDEDVITVYPVFASGNYRGINYATVLHEVYHHITTDLLSVDTTFAKRIDSLRLELIQSSSLSPRDKAIIEAYDYPGGSVAMWKDVKTGKIEVNDLALVYSLTTKEEFIGNMINNTQFRKLASSTVTKTDTSFLQKFWGMLKQAMAKLGLTKSDITTLDATLGAIDSAWDKDIKSPGLVRGARLKSFDFDEQMAYLKISQDAPVDKDGWIKRGFDSATTWGKTVYRKGFRGIDEALGDIHPDLKAKFKGYGTKRGIKIINRRNSVESWVNSLTRLKKNDAKLYERYKFAMLNYRNEASRVTLEEMHRDNPSTLGDFTPVEKVIKTLAKEMVEVGLISKSRVNYFPNKVKDFPGLMEKMHSLGEGNILAEIAGDLKAKNGVDPTEAQVVDALGSALSRGVYPAMLTQPGTAKKKSIWNVKPELIEFYHDPFVALLSHIERSTKSIEQHVLVGKSSQGKQEEVIEDLTSKKKPLTDKQRLKLAEAKVILTNIEGEFDNNISKWINKKAVEGELTATDQQIVRDLIHANFNEVMTPSTLAWFKTVGTIGALGSFTSTITQIPDLAGTMSFYGFKRTLGVIFSRHRLFTRDDILASVAIEDIGLEGNAQKMLKWTLKLNAFAKVDAVFKDVAMEAALRKAQAMSRDAFTKKYEAEFDGRGEVDALYNDIKANRKTFLTGRFSLSNLSNVQPTSTSSMPEFYAKHPVGRMVYVLKGFAVKILNNLDNTYRAGLKEGYIGIKPGHKAATVKLMTYIATLIALGAPVGCAQQLMQGKECDFMGEVADSALMLAGLNRYSTKSISDGHIGDFIAGQFTPPMGWIEKPVKDLKTMLVDGKVSWKTATEVPLVGKFLWNWTSEAAAKKRLSEKRKKIFAINKELTVSKGKSTKQRVELSKAVREYNTKARKYGLKPVTGETLYRSVERYRATQRAKNKLKHKENRKTSSSNVLADLGGAIGSALSPREAIAKDYSKQIAGGYTNKLKIQENDPLFKGKYSGKIFPNKPPEDAKDGAKATRDIGYGHKITPRQEKAKMIYGIDFSNGITEQQASWILVRDIEKHARLARLHVGKDLWDNLNQAGKDLLTDFSFTGTLGKFPNMFDAIRSRDKQRVIREYRRYFTKGGEKTEMKRRNAMALKLIKEMVSSW